MTFQRARSTEQKDVRKQQIIDAALALYKDNRYEDITLASIAKELSFSRANLYKYASSKEEIFLWAIEYKMNMWVGDVAQCFALYSDLSVEQFADIWATKLYDHKTMLGIMTYLYSSIEPNVSLDSLVEFKSQVYQMFASVMGSIAKFLPMLDAKQMMEFFDMEICYLMGLYPSCNQPVKMQEAIKISGVQYTQPDFVESITKMTIIIINGLTG